MALRIHEVHPTLVHFPLALIPLAVVCDLVGVATGNRSLLRTGRRLMPIAAASGVVAGASGLVAQGSVEVNEAARPVLATHRNLNLGLVLMTGALALWRRASLQPSTGYLAVATAAVAAMNYTAYLGGKLVYHHGVGVEKAGGVKPERSPELRWQTAGAAAQASVRHGTAALRHTVQDLRSGEVAPALTGDVPG